MARHHGPAVRTLVLAAFGALTACTPPLFTRQRLIPVGDRDQLMDAAVAGAHLVGLDSVRVDREAGRLVAQRVLDRRSPGNPSYPCDHPGIAGFAGSCGGHGPALWRLDVRLTPRADSGFEVKAQLTAPDVTLEDQAYKDCVLRSYLASVQAAATAHPIQERLCRV